MAEQETNKNKSERLWHSTAHIMAAAVGRLYDNVLFDIGPATADGFYYDFDLPHRLTLEDLPRIEKEMAAIVKENLPFERLEMSRPEAQRLLEKAGQKYKLERLADIPEGETITFYRLGNFIDLCRGPHLESTGQAGTFKLLSVAGSYYRGSEKNPMLQRLYGVAFSSPDGLAEYLHRIEEAALRDHRRLGKDLDLFSVQDHVGPGLIHWHPKGARVRAIIEEFWRQEHFRNGYDLLYTPHIGQARLWETSGHLSFYKENMYAPMDIDETAYYIKPMNCPFHIQIYKNRKRSYRELPLRWAELGTVYRYEKSGVLHGLLRVRGFTQDDAHIICTPEQMNAEIRKTLRFAVRLWKTFGFNNMYAFLATRPEGAVGHQSQWADATAALKQALEEENMPYAEDAGGGAFYGPKIDIKVKDAIGREWQMSTIQFDFNLPERFDMTYTASDGQNQRPYMIHRALLGSLERFFGILVEHYAGAFPFWLAPEQVRVLPLTERQLAYAESITSRLGDIGLRAKVDYSQEKIGAKIRTAQMEKVPYMIVVGGKEEAGNAVSLRCRSEGDLGVMSLEEAVDRKFRPLMTPEHL